MKDDEAHKRRRIAVTGSTGMLGGHLVAEMVRAGYSDIILVVRNAGNLDNMYGTFDRLGVEVPEEVITVVETDLTDSETLGRKLRDIDTVFNCAARIMSGNMTNGELIENNASIARSVVDWCLGSGIRKLIHVSSISALGQPGPDGLINEACEPESVDNFAAYGKSKYYSEREVWRGAEAGLEVVIVSPGVILGEGNAKANNSAALIPLISSGMPFYTDGLMSYVDVRDVARAIIALDAQPGAAGQKFILSAGDMSYRELIREGAKVSRRPPPFIKIGEGAISFAYSAMQKMISLGLMKDKGVTKENLGSVLRDVRYDGSKITKVCGFWYTPLDQTIERVVKNSRK